VEFSPRVHPRSARASPAVKHGVSPPGTVGEYAMSLGRVDAIRAWTNAIRMRAKKLMEFSSTIRAWTDTIRLSTDSLIILPRTIRIFA